MIQPFLDKVASNLWTCFGHELSEKSIVFPNKRSALYFSNYLKKYVEGTFISPQIVTINEFFANTSELVVAENTILLRMLYDSVQKVSPTGEAFDQFYPFASIILGDFDSMDKHMVNVEELLQNISSLKEIDAKFSYLTPEQIDAISQFWSTFEVEKQSQEQKAFLHLWSILYPVYKHFNDSLDKAGLAYEGKIFRELAKKLGRSKSNISETHHIFIGFNVLSKAEEYVFSHLQQLGKALFYWDYDPYFIDNKYNEAGRFIRKHIQNFSAHNTDFSTDGYSEEKNAKLLTCVGEVQQVKALGELLSKEMADEELKKTAIVLANEDLLLKLLESIPKEINALNVSMGFPLAESGWVQLLKALAQLQKTMVWKGQEAYFSVDWVRVVLQNVHIRKATVSESVDCLEIIEKRNQSQIAYGSLPESIRYIFQPLRNVEDFFFFLDILQTRLFVEAKNELIEREAILHTQKIVRTMTTTLSGLHLQQMSFCFLLLIRELEQLRVPFQTTKEEGVQIIGFLESRLLDFEKVYILSANEDFLPNINLAGSLIPYNLRIGAGLPTLDEQNSMYAYYFYRLLSRAKEVTFFTVDGAEQTKMKEPSRYIRQLMSEAPFSIEKYTVNSAMQWRTDAFPLIEKDEQVQTVFQNYFDGVRKVSASALNQYLRCPQSFYYKYIAGIEERTSVANAEEYSMFGSIFHKAVELLYTAYLNEEITTSLLDKIGQKKNLEAVIHRAFVEELFGGDDKRKLEGKELLIFDILFHYLKKIITYDKKCTPFEILHLEKKIEYTLEIEVFGEMKQITLKGLIDRVDRKDGTVRIVDYKTGRVNNNKIQSLEHLFIPCHKDNNSIGLQILLYAWVYGQESGEYPLPLVYTIRDARIEVPIVDAEVKTIPFDIRLHSEDFEKYLKKLLAEIFGEEPVFYPTEDEDNCIHDMHTGICQIF